MKQRLITWLLIAPCLLLNPTLALAQEEVEIYDARLESYATGVTLDSRSTALLWIMVTVLAFVCVGVMFKDAKRSHLD